MHHVYGLSSAWWGRMNVSSTAVAKRAGDVAYGAAFRYDMLCHDTIQYDISRYDMLYDIIVCYIILRGAARCERPRRGPPTR